MPKNTDITANEDNLWWCYVPLTQWVKDLKSSDVSLCMKESGIRNEKILLSNHEINK